MYKPKNNIMKIALKKIAFSERMSEETNCFQADIYINGKKVGYCRNDGRGGCTEYHGNTKEDNEVIAETEAYFKTLPKVKPIGYNFEYQPTLESAIDDEFENWLKEKELKKLFQKAIVFGKPNSMTYKYVNFKRPLGEVPNIKLKNHIAQILNHHCTNDEVILNTNFKIENGNVIFL